MKLEHIFFLMVMAGSFHGSLNVSFSSVLWKCLLFQVGTRASLTQRNISSGKTRSQRHVKGAIPLILKGRFNWALPMPSTRHLNIVLLWRTSIVPAGALDTVV